MSEQELQNKALTIANDIFSNGRINNPEDWDEMEVELSFAMDEENIEGNDRQVVFDTVKQKWY